ELAPGQGRCIAFERIEICSNREKEPSEITELRAALMAKKAVLALTGNPVCAGKCDVGLFRKSPEEFVNKYSNMPVPPLVKWSVLRRDHAREVMFAPFDALLIEDKYSFICELYDGECCLRKERAIPVSDGRFVVLLAQSRNNTAHEKTLKLSVRRFYPDHHSGHFSGKLILLPEPEKRKIRFSFEDVKKSGQLVFCSNSSGGYAMFPAAWGEINSKYEAILAANTNSRYPVDRRVLFSGLKAWLVTNDYSQEITSAFSDSFISGIGNGAKWSFSVPSGQGKCVALDIEFDMAENGNAVRFKFARRHHAGEESDAPAKLILRPALEDRINHELTKAFLGPEQEFPRSVISGKEGFEFNRSDCSLSVNAPGGRFVSEPEWYYMCPLPHEAYYGLESATDRFSPGYFEIVINPGSEALLTACVNMKNAPAEELVWQDTVYLPLGTPEDFAVESLRRFVVKRDDLSTVLAGYPWFLDWGRDTLIVLRGLVRIKEFKEQSVRIIRAFAGLEREGSIPNVIRGEFESNRDTCDAPLYLILAVRDFIDATKDDSILVSDCRGKTLREVLRSIIRHYKEGTCNGIRMDENSKLIYSPSHFSWMDTNYPAGTPRSGYPVEIQALWYAALEFMGEKELALQVSESIEKYFFVNDRCSDCLHCSAGTPAEHASADDHNRSNQLLLITLNAIKDPEKIRLILDSAAELLVPGGIRSLADEQVSFSLPVYHHGRLLNDPVHPYRGKYCGPEDTERKVAYHNGTVWCWPFPAYCEALFMAGGPVVRKRALTILMSVAKYFECGAAGQLPEVADGDAPHIPGGCPAQAWSLSEFYRVYGLLKIQNS
ncbi:MAG: glycogen debranching enzyme N-terminal domain-containing protein, partial [Lentisphaeria bacterium]|nr:glycogen debranching enzyme N-terminal domain-containing protein [Lentisphaeria bacterium]